MPDPNQNPWGSWGGQSGGQSGPSWGSFFGMPSQNVMGAIRNYGMGYLGDATQERAAPGTTQFAGMPVTDLANLDRINALYHLGYDNPLAAPLAAGGLSAYELGKYAAQNIPGGISAWNATVGQIPSGENVSNFSLDASSSPASMSNVSSVLASTAAGVSDRLGLSNYGMPNFSDVSSGSSTTSPVSSLMTAAGITPSQSVIDTAQNIGLGDLYNVVAAERANPGSTQLAGTSTADLANLDRLGEFYARAQSDPAYAPLLAAIIPGYELAKGAAQTIPGGQAIWNAGVNAATAISPNPIGIPLNELTMDNTTSPASMTNATSGLGGLAAGLYDRYRGTVDTGMPNFSDVHGGGSSTGIPSQSSMDVTAPYFTGTPPNSGPQEPFNDAFAGIATNPTFQNENNMPGGNTNFNTLVPDPNAPASPAPGSIDFGPSASTFAPYTPRPQINPDQQYSAAQGGANMALDPALAAMYSNTSGAGTSALNLSEATSHPSYMNYLAWLSQNHPYSGSWLGQ